MIAGLLWEHEILGIPHGRELGKTKVLGFARDSVSDDLD